ncbi:hypothetical protein C2G38_2145198 [Gigaspora rosea]|uniref:SAM domain-containing protein n=1 Tax=Gigaspora rosea TaxID=44941 RepID=A0A397USF9_9GLOM|nr:hypothetical protein C2G38_2145198 [Gigaspora rosea]
MSLESNLPSGTLNNEEVLLHTIKQYNTNELIEYLQNKDLKLDDDDFTIIRKEKIAGLDFFDLTREEFRSIGMALGPATRLAKLITEIKELKMPPHELRQQNHNLNQSSNFQEDNYSDIVEKNDSYTAEKNGSKDTETNKFCGPYTALYVNETIFVSEKTPAILYLPENASQLLRYYDFWIRPYIEWNLIEFSEHLRKVHNINEKNLIHSSFKINVGVLKKLFLKDHPVQLRLLELENQLKSQQNEQKREKVRRRKFAGKLASLKKKIEKAKDSVILSGYNRINEHYDDFHGASSLLVKRNLIIDDDSLEPNLKKAKKNIFQDSD